jgi:bifunctional non-homologous end joining protein LigD
MLPRPILPPRLTSPCLPTPADTPPTGTEWLHEIKHDGFRMLIRKGDQGIQLFTSRGPDWAERYPKIASAVCRIDARSCVIDGEAVCCNREGIPDFSLLRYPHNDVHVVLRAFDLLEVDGRELQDEPIETRKRVLWSLMPAIRGLQYVQHLEGGGTTIFAGACRAGLEGIVSKRKGSPYVPGRSAHWVRLKNPKSPAAIREAAGGAR